MAERKVKGEKNKAGRPPKFDYDSDEFYDEIFALALNGATDSEIAVMLEDKFGCSLCAEAFSSMKNGNYHRWTKEENKRRSERLVKVLTHARQRLVLTLRNTYVKMAFGKIKTKNKATVSRRLRIDGQLTDDEEVQTTVSDIEYAPNLQAISTLLYHYDKDWKMTQRGLDEADDIPKVEHGVSIGDWIEQENKKEK